ncbi:MAG: BrnT family toxin [Chthoniobacterales bacterium]
MPLTFEWDSRKAPSNVRKHRVSFAEASLVFADPSSLTIFDPEHSAGENRFVTIGRALTGKLLVVVHTDRADNIRIISARQASRRERKVYGER